MVSGGTVLLYCNVICDRVERIAARNIETMTTPDQVSHRWALDPLALFKTHTPACRIILVRLYLYLSLLRTIDLLQILYLTGALF